MDIYTDGSEYDLLGHAYASGEELDFYLRQAQRWADSSPVLELGCGTGRLTIPIAERGFAAVGIDIASSMLDTARQKADKRGLTNISFLQADVRDFDLAQQFGLIFFPVNSLSHLHHLDDIRACFDSVRRHLHAEGRFVIDIFTPSFALLSRDADRRYPVAEYTNEAGKQVVVTESNTYDAASQINYLTWHYRSGEEEWMRSFAMRQFFPQEIDALLTLSGLTIESKWGDYSKKPFGRASLRQLIVCRAANIDIRQSP